jgi:glutamate N-acetyltransferase/amino-acid N-acetyltransferase
LGFRAAAVAAGLRYPDRLDLGLIVADRFQASAGVFTTSVCRAAPVIWSRRSTGTGRAILANSGQANAQTGERGLSDCQESANNVASLLGLEPSEVLLASTGVIGQPINLPAMLAALPKLKDKLSPDGFDDFARAIMTTDTVPKTASTSITLPPGVETSIWGCAKGSGMIAPNMATMLGFVLTDAAIEPGLLREFLKEAADATFNRITVDGDTSTNDTLLVIASGAAGGKTIAGGPEAALFFATLREVMDNLARALVRDGEGATKLVEILVNNAKNVLQAKKAARTVAESPLVKTAFFGGDANWGRILAALGRSGAEFDPYQVDLDLGDVPWIRNGRDNGMEERASLAIKEREQRLTIDLKAGSASWSMLTCDLSHGYVEINGSYRS